jgi:hypothetical protein
MKEFIKLWLHNAGKLTLVILAIITFIVVVLWLDSYGTLGYIGIGIWTLFCIITILTLIEHNN